MKRFGSFKPLDTVISSDVLSKLHVAVSSVTELTDAYPNNTIAVFTKPDGEFKQGDVAIKKNGIWSRLKTYLPTLGPVTELRGFRLDKRVYLKYKSPANRCDNRGNTIASWKKEIVVRKYGSQPTSELDGTVVRVIVKKDVFSKNASKYLVDYIPDADNDSQWYYRVFVQADNGTIDYNTTAPGITIHDMPWSNIIEAVRSGHAKEVFAVGDAFRLDDGNEMVVADITTRSPYRVTMLLRYPRYMLPFDTKKPSGFKYTRDTRAVARKTYRKYNPQTGEYDIKSLYVGAPIMEPLYEDVKASLVNYGTAHRPDNGSNRWSTSDIRYWLNLTMYSGVTNADVDFMSSIGGILTEEQFENPSLIPDGTPIPPYLYLKKYIPDILECLVSTSNRTSVPVSDGTGLETTQERFFIPSITELTGITNGDKYAEGTQFELFSKGLETRSFQLLDPTSSNPFTSIDACFTRSPYLMDPGSIGYNLVPAEIQLYMAGDGSYYADWVSGTGISPLVASSNNGILVAFNIG